jgi:hypothetical protein
MSKTMVVRHGVPEVAEVAEVGQDPKTGRYAVTAEDGTYGEGDTVMEAADAVTFQISRRAK